MLKSWQCLAKTKIPKDTRVLSQCRFQTKKKPHQANLVLGRPNPVCKALNAVARSYFLTALGFFLLAV